MTLHQFASTGPPHRCGGRTPHGAQPSPRGCGFNGAAASLRRKGRQHGSIRARRPCFNGAAASLRRKGLPGRPERRRVAPLQRGRRIAAAEGQRRRQWYGYAKRFNGAAASLRRKEGAQVACGPSGIMLQRGRRIAAAEGRASREEKRVGGGLQRGRRIAAAEGS